MPKYALFICLFVCLFLEKPRLKNVILDFLPSFVIIKVSLVNRCKYGIIFM